MDGDLLRRQLISQLEGGAAYAPVEETIRDTPAAYAGRRLGEVSRTLWQLLEHMRIAQWDILHFMVDRSHVSPPWPDGYWPGTDAPPDDRAWSMSAEAFLGDLGDVKRLASDPASDLSARIEWGTGQTILREILLVADHNAYHLGQLMLIRRAIEAAGG